MSTVRPHQCNTDHALDAPMLLSNGQKPVPFGYPMEQTQPTTFPVMKLKLPKLSKPGIVPAPHCFLPGGRGLRRVNADTSGNFC